MDHTGLARFERYLAKSWSRAGIPPSRWDDCTQDVYCRILETTGRDGLDAILAGFGSGIPVADFDEGTRVEFYRAVDCAAKRSLRLKQYASIDDDHAAPEPGNPVDFRDWLDRRLSGPERDIILATIEGRDPAEIGGRLGVSPKTIYNARAAIRKKLGRHLLSA